MAYIRKRGKRWHAEICKTGPDGAQIRESASRSTKAEAVSWAEQREAEIAGGSVVIAKRTTFGQLLERYAAEVSPTKRGERWERIRIQALVHGRPDSFPAARPILSPLSAWQTSTRATSPHGVIGDCVQFLRPAFAGNGRC